VHAEEPLGRHLELRRVDAFLDELTVELTALSVVGPAGIGKTTVWRDAVGRAEMRGYLVLAARPSQAERRMAFTGLADLLSVVDAASLQSLPAVQRRAIDVALLREDAGTARPTPRAVATAVLSLLQSLAEAGPVLLAVDDAQWLDVATATALEFALRRLELSAVGVLTGVRVDDQRRPTFDSVVPRERSREMMLGPMSTAALHDIIKRQLDRTFPRPTLVQIATASGGNPFYALEIAREIERSGPPKPGSRVPVPGELRTLVRARVARLPGRARDALLVASCLSQPSLSLIDPDSIAAAEAAEIVRVERDGQIRFTHPLLASAVYESASIARRRSVHRELAGRVGDPEERARQLGLAADGPDETIAAALEAAAERVASRGAPAAAAELARGALELTVDPHDEIATRRAMALAQHLVYAGESLAARQVLEAALPDHPNSELHAELLLRLGSVCYFEGDLDAGYEHLEAALQNTQDAELAARIHVQAAWLAEADSLRALGHCDAVLGLIDAEHNPGPYSTALLYGAYLRLTTGQGADDGAVERGRRLQEQAGSWDEASQVPALWAELNDDFAVARERYEVRLQWSRLIGDENVAQSVLGHLAELECWTGDWERADHLADEALQLAERVGSGAYRKLALYARAYVDVLRGRVDEAQASAEASLHTTTGMFASSGLRDVRAHQVLGFLALSLQDPSSADVHYTLATEGLDDAGHREPARFRFQPDHVEAVIELGDLTRADALLARLLERVRTFPRPWILATTARCRGLLLAARGDLGGAMAAIDGAIAHHEKLDMPFERGRTLLVRGQVLRRRKERRAARAALEEALASFEQLGSPLWAHRVRAELARIPVRSAPAELTPTEEQIAMLAAGGLTNRVIAERAFVSPKTVEANLARVYSKLGLHSRAELGRAMAERERVSKT
jgi:DNA-binding CsgD family transcriptional regulator